MGKSILSFLSRDWAGLPVAGIVGLLGGACVATGRPVSAGWAIGVVIVIIAALLAIGALWHIVHMARVRAKHPPPGKLVDVGGYRLHVLAEGEARGKPAVVWMPGGHGAGFAFHHLHRVLREETRSILIDRPGTGWSDLGPFPRTTAGEAREVIAALQGAGEEGSFVLVGHSFGGLLMANVARRWPARVAALVMADATPPDTIIYGPRIPGLKQMRSGAVLNALPRLFGIHMDFAERRQRRQASPAYKRILDLYEERLGEAAATMRAVEGGTRSACAGASIFAELSASGLAEVAWETVVYEGDLGDLPVLLVAPGAMEDGEFDAVVMMLEKEAGARTVDRERLRRFYTRSRERYMTISSRSRRVYAPAGTGHNFPYETPEFLADVVRSVLKPAGPEHHRGSLS
ncbi:MAG: hypothetical protein C3F15_06770 [Holophagae bacterium]|nr:MAG: hypothetical protein C3F15_06770 [Holophagae bacterium]